MGGTSEESECVPRLVLHNDDGCRSTPRQQRDALQCKKQDLFQFVKSNKVLPCLETVANKSCKNSYRRLSHSHYHIH
jgi:hypothetical protein